MSILLFLTSTLLFTSGALKLRASARAGIGISPLAVAEGLAAVGIAVAALPGIGSAPTAPWVVLGALGVMLASSAQHALRLKAHHERRSASEAGRLVNYVKYMSNTDEGS